MEVDAVIRFFALLAVLCEIGTAAVLGLWIYSRVSPSGKELWATTRREVGPYATWLAAAVALVAMGGSLYMSEVAKFQPCLLCWWQRGFMYPLGFVLIALALTKNKYVYWLATAGATIGLGISTFHYYLENFPESEALQCGTGPKCTEPYFWEFGYLTLAAMAGSGFMFILAMLAISKDRPFPSVTKGEQ